MYPWSGVSSVSVKIISGERFRVRQKNNQTNSSILNICHFKSEKPHVKTLKTVCVCCHIGGNVCFISCKGNGGVREHGRDQLRRYVGSGTVGN